MRGLERGLEVAKKIIEAIQPAKCKYCGSAEEVVRFGTYKGVQRWYCKKCKRKFSDTDTLPRMKTPVRHIASALSMYYGGMSLNSIRRHLDQQYGYRPSESTLYEWLTRFSKIAIKEAKDYKPNVGDVWIADETVLKIGGDKIWFWDIIDTKTRFLLASHMSFTRTTKDAESLMRQAYNLTGKIPRVIYTDKLRAYLDGIELTFGADTEHRQGSPFDIENNTNIIEPTSTNT